MQQIRNVLQYLQNGIHVKTVVLLRREMKFHSEQTLISDHILCNPSYNFWHSITKTGVAVPWYAFIITKINSTCKILSYSYMKIKPDPTTCCRPKAKIKSLKAIYIIKKLQCMWIMFVKYRETYNAFSNQTIPNSWQLLQMAFNSV